MGFDLKFGEKYVIMINNRLIKKLHEKEGTMKHKYREKTSTGFFCTKYGCKFNDPDFCKKRAENDVDDMCQLCTGIEPIEKVKGKHSNLEFSTKGMNRKKAA